ncbi:aldo/keto reductase [Halobacteria archaeon AArc-m2/3/4]|uniref:Aldo/keto reductase n=1 Tax=Natronoglomus mannanivorans TaxID=2979990 RepID=A0ABT2QJ22_9EURY|nr:aldo/keto reductase [Halobacteria archaeon AArc-m2/3/4]
MLSVTARGVEIPALGFGTARMDDHDERVRAIAAALEAGYRHIDTAQVYGSESAVGEAIQKADVDREELFVTTKLTDDNRAHGDVIHSVHESLDHLEMETVDLLLIHSPNDEVSHEETLDAMNELRDDGLVSHLGVSNFSVDQTREAVAHSTAPIVTNQVEYHLHHRQDDLLEYCIDEEMMLTAYSPLGVGDALDEDVLQEIGDRHDKTAAQVAIRWLLQQPQVSTIPMSSSPDHVRENFDVFDFELTGEEMRDVFRVTGGLSDDLASKLDL